ncbi:MAG: glycosyltransferase family 4 protein [Pseudomonadota bacterium]
MSRIETSKPVAYLTSVYPAVSHTFILREIEALKTLGLDVKPFSVRQPPANHLTGKPEKNAFSETFYVLKEARNPLRLLKAQLAAFNHSRAYFSTLKLAWATSAPGIKAHIYQLIYFVEATILAQEFRDQEIRHVHNHFADNPANVAMLAGSLAEIPFSYTLHGPAELYEPQRWVLDVKTARANFVACISHFARSQAMYFSDPKHWHKLKIIHCGIEPSLYDRPAKPKSDDTTNLVFVGRLTAIKGLRVLLEAFSRALETNPDLHLTLIGDGDDRAHLEELAKPLGDAIHFAGYQSQDAVAEAMSQADIFVLPSFAEGVPVVLMEAMAAARPVITSLVAGIPELVQDGVSGYLVPPGDAETLAARIETLSADPELRDKMGRHGRQKVQTEFNIHSEAARIGTLLNGQIDGPIRPDPLTAGGTR